MASADKYINPHTYIDKSKAEFKDKVIAVCDKYTVIELTTADTCDPGTVASKMIDSKPVGAVIEDYIWCFHDSGKCGTRARVGDSMFQLDAQNGSIGFGDDTDGYVEHVGTTPFLEIFHDTSGSCSVQCSSYTAFRSDIDEMAKIIRALKLEKEDSDSFDSKHHLQSTTNDMEKKLIKKINRQRYSSAHKWYDAMVDVGTGGWWFDELNKESRTREGTDLPLGIERTAQNIKIWEYIFQIQWETILDQSQWPGECMTKDECDGVNGSWSTSQPDCWECKSYDHSNVCATLESNHDRAILYAIPEGMARRTQFSGRLVSVVDGERKTSFCDTNCNNADISDWTVYDEDDDGVPWSISRVPQFEVPRQFPLVITGVPTDVNGQCTNCLFQGQASDEVWKKAQMDKDWKEHEGKWQLNKDCAFQTWCNIHPGATITHIDGVKVIKDNWKILYSEAMDQHEGKNIKWRNRKCGGQDCDMKKVCAPVNEKGCLVPGSPMWSNKRLCGGATNPCENILAIAETTRGPYKTECNDDQGCVGVKVQGRKTACMDFYFYKTTDGGGLWDDGSQWTSSSLWPVWIFLGLALGSGSGYAVAKYTSSDPAQHRPEHYFTAAEDEPIKAEAAPVSQNRESVRQIELQQEQRQEESHRSDVRMWQEQRNHAPAIGVGS